MYAIHICSCVILSFFSTVPLWRLFILNDLHAQLTYLVLVHSATVVTTVCTGLPANKMIAKVLHWCFRFCTMQKQQFHVLSVLFCTHMYMQVLVKEIALYWSLIAVYHHMQLSLNISRSILLFSFRRYSSGSSQCDDYSLCSCLDSISTWLASQDKCLHCRYNKLSHWDQLHWLQFCRHYWNSKEWQLQHYSVQL